MVKKQYFAISICLMGLAFRTEAQVDWPLLSFSPVLTNTFSAPTCIVHAGDGSGRIFVVEQNGFVRIIRSNNVLSVPFLNITNRVLRGTEQGLLGLAFPAGFSNTGHFYVDYTRKPDGATVISRFLVTTNQDLADTNSEQILKIIAQPFANHNGGQLAFGPDGYLYIGMGDGGYSSANGIGDPQKNAQNPLSLLGKILRIDVEGGSSPYGIPANNPFIGNTNYAPEIWALGVRNPWRFSFDRQTGDLYIADVGHFRWEEVDFQPAGSQGGQNYGWRIKEGTNTYMVPAGFTNFSSLTDPVTWYDHFTIPTDGSAAIIGGYVYRGPGEPRMGGMYFFGDEPSGEIWGLKQDGTNWQQALLRKVGTSQFPTNWAISTFGEDEQGRLYFADYAHGSVYQIHDSGQVWSPIFIPPNGIINTDTALVSCLTTGAVIHYTTNGVDPTESDPIVPTNGFVSVRNGATNKAKAFRSDLTPSVVATAVFGFKVGTPTFSPPPGPVAGAVTNNTQITISTVTPGAAIYYTMDGSPPSSNSFLYTGPVLLSGNGNLSPNFAALGVATGYTNSSIGRAVYYPASVENPGFTPASGPITNHTQISMSCSTPSATIYYTLNGSTPTTNSTLYTSPFLINGGTTVSAFAIASNYLDSGVDSVFYALVQTATPVFIPAAGPVVYGTSVSLSCATTGSVIYFTLDGSPPTTNSILYSSPLVITNDVMLSALAVTPEHLDSAVLSGLYTLIQVATPSFSPSQGPLTNGASISVGCATSNAIVRYTLDGSDPQTNSPTYSAPIPFSLPFTLKARAYAPQHDPSDINAVFYGLINSDNTVVTTLAGRPTAGFSNAVGTFAQFSSPQGIGIDSSGNLYVADTGNSVIRKVLQSGGVTTFAGTGVAGSQDGPAGSAQFSSPVGIFVDRTGTVFVADGCNLLRKVSTNGMVTTLGAVDAVCGIGQLAGDPDGNLYVGSWAKLIRMTSGGQVTGLAGTGCNCPGGWATHVGPGVDALTNLYAATGGNVWKIVPGISSDIFAGGNNFFSDGPRLQAGFEGLQAAYGDSSTNLLLSELTRIRKMRADGWVSTIAGMTQYGFQNGPGSIAQFNNAAGLCADTNKNVYVADAGNNCIRKISPDTAGIGIADDWQLSHFGHIGIDPSADPDGDGRSNYAEFWAGTDPLDSHSVLAIDKVSIGGTNRLRLITWRSVPGKVYTVTYSTDLTSWNTLSNFVQAIGTNTSIIDPTAIQLAGHRFYRVLVNF
jgi:glucose/arabinose dehydrogenase/streptogramin lyase